MRIRLDIEGKHAGSIKFKGAGAAEMALTYINDTEADEISIQLVKPDGTKAYADFEGEFWSMSATKFILSAVKSERNIPEPLHAVPEDIPQPDLTLKERLEMFLRFEYPRVWFSSLDVKRQYESVYGKINLSTVSTYLARMHRDNILERKGNRNQREYRFMDKGNPLMNIEYALSK